MLKKEFVIVVLTSSHDDRNFSQDKELPALQDISWIFVYNVKAAMSHSGSFKWQQQYSWLVNVLDVSQRNDRNNFRICDCLKNDRTGCLGPFAFQQSLQISFNKYFEELVKLHTKQVFVISFKWKCFNVGPLRPNKLLIYTSFTKSILQTVGSKTWSSRATALLVFQLALSYPLLIPPLDWLNTLDPGNQRWVGQLHSKIAKQARWLALRTRFGGPLL